MKKLIANGIDKKINSKVQYDTLGRISDEASYKCYLFAYDMTFGDIGEHRSHRSGGEHRRKLGEIFANTYNGKLAEYAVYNEIKKKCEISEPDFTMWKKGKWDDVDFRVNGFELSKNQ